MSAFAVSGLLIFLSSIGMSWLVFTKNNSSKVNRIWSVFCLSVALWGIGCFGIGLSQSASRALMLWRIAYVGVIFIPSLFYYFVDNFLLLQNKKTSGFLFFISVCFLLLNFTNAMMPSVTWRFGEMHYLGPPGLVYPVFVSMFVVVVVVSHINLLNCMRSASVSNAKREQVKWFFLATVVGFLGGVTCFLPVFGFNLYPYGNFSVPLYPIIMTYAIVKHQLMDIEVVIRRTAVFAGLFVFVYFVFSLVTIVGQEYFKASLGWNQWIATIPTVLLITFSMRPLENLLTNLTEKFLFQKKYDYRELLRTFTNEVLTILDLQKLTEQTIVDLTKIIKLESASILLLDADTKEYRIAAASGLKDKGLVFKPADTLITYLRQSHQPLIKDKEAESMEGHSSLRDDFKKLNAQICLPIAHHDELLGVLCLGMKKSGEEFTPEDIDILMTLARTEGIAIANAQLFDQLSKTQAEAAQREKMAVIGTLAAGINHEICNPLGIVRGQCEMFLLNLRDNLYNEKTKDELVKISTEIMNKVIRETDRATAITKRLSGFAKPAKKTDSEEVSVEKETEEVLGLVGHDLKLSNIEFRKEFEVGFPTILADRRQIQEVLFNIIRNAAQAMDKNDGCITLSGVSANGMAIVKIADNGSGIPKDKIGQIFNPFFTTKEPGKGTGLGLFIVRQVVERNHGTIAVDSEDGVGTTFTLTFPATATVKAIAA